MRSTLAPLALAAVMALSGCLGALQQTEEGPLMRELPLAAPVTALEQCGPSECFEPSSAVDGAGRIFVTAGYQTPIAVSADGGRTFLPVPRPVMPLSGLISADALVQSDPQGAVWFSDIAAPATPGLLAKESRLNSTAVHLARTTDGGRTWAPNVVVDTGMRVDRQWLAFAGRDEVYVSFIGVGKGIQVMRSTDGGLTFGKPVTVDADGIIAGAMVVDASGRLYLPHFQYKTSTVAVSTSDDRGASWTSRAAYRGPLVGDFFPRIASDGSALHLAWRGSDKALHVATSTDRGVTWTAPESRTVAGDAVAVSPALVARHGVITVAYFDAVDKNDSAHLRIVRHSPGTVWTATAAADVPATDSNLIKKRPGNSDFADLTLLPDGRVLTAWADGKGHLLVRVEAAEG